MTSSKIWRIREPGTIEEIINNYFSDHPFDKFIDLKIVYCEMLYTIILIVDSPKFNEEINN